MIKILISLILLFPISLSSAGEKIYINADKQLDFAEEYFSKGEYLKAIAEYERFIFLFQKDERVKKAMHQIGMAYYNSRRFNDAIDAFNDLIEKYGKSDISDADVTKAYFMLSECYVKLNAFEQAVSNLHYMLTLTSDKDITDETYYRIGWIYLEKGDSSNARNYFEKIENEKYRIRELYAGLDKESLIPRKNPVLAGVLSVIPGGGFLYCERYYDALTAFLLNSLLIYAAYESFDNDMNALGGLISLVETGFYTGNIYGGITSAHKYNKDQHNRFTDQLKKSMRISISPYNKNGDFLFSFHFDF